MASRVQKYTLCGFTPLFVVSPRHLFFQLKWMSPLRHGIIINQLQLISEKLVTTSMLLVKSPNLLRGCYLLGNKYIWRAPEIASFLTSFRCCVCRRACGRGQGGEEMRECAGGRGRKARLVRVIRPAFAGQWASRVSSGRLR